MPKPYASAVLSASADEVWALIRDFSTLAAWHPGIESCEIVEGTGDSLGSVRELRVPGGGDPFHERLVALDDAERTCTYEFVDSPFPVRSYRSTFRVAPVTDGGQAFVEWWAWFDADAKDEEAMSKTFSKGVYATGLSALRERFA